MRSTNLTGLDNIIIGTCIFIITSIILIFSKNIYVWINKKYKYNKRVKNKELNFRDIQLILDRKQVGKKIKRKEMDAYEDAKAYYIKIQDER